MVCEKALDRSGFSCLDRDTRRWRNGALAGRALAVRGFATRSRLGNYLGVGCSIAMVEDQQDATYNRSRNDQFTLKENRNPRGVGIEWRLDCNVRHECSPRIVCNRDVCCGISNVSFDEITRSTGLKARIAGARYGCVAGGYRDWPNALASPSCQQRKWIRA